LLCCALAAGGCAGPWGLKRDSADEDTDAQTRAAIKERDDPRRVAQEEARKLDMGGTALPVGVDLLNPAAPGTSSKPGKH